MFELIYECSANRVAAKALVDRMLERVRAAHSIKKTGGKNHPVSGAGLKQKPPSTARSRKKRKN
jgi:hypothetical protein